MAGKYILEAEDPDVKLVHGIILSPLSGVRFPVLLHAWIEENGEVYDLVLEEHWPKDAYYRYFRAVPKIILSKEEFREKVLQSGHWALQGSSKERR